MMGRRELLQAMMVAIGSLPFFKGGEASSTKPKPDHHTIQRPSVPKPQTYEGQFAYLNKTSGHRGSGVVIKLLTNKTPPLGDVVVHCGHQQFAVLLTAAYLTFPAAYPDTPIVVTGELSESLTWSEWQTIKDQLCTIKVFPEP